MNNMNIAYSNLAYAVALQALKDNDFYFFNTEYYSDVIQPLIRSDKLKDIAERLHNQGFRYFHSKFRPLDEIVKIRRYNNG